MRSYFVVYNQILDCFVRVKKLTPDDISTLFKDLDELIGNEDLNNEKFIRFVSKGIVQNYEALSKKYNDVSVFAEAVYECVTEVYPMLTTEVACTHYNSVPEEDDEPCVISYDNDGLNMVRKDLGRNLLGQDHAIDKVLELLKLVNSGFESFGSLFFIGPTGVGKTELARLLAEHYLKDPKKLVKINCAEYSGQHEYAKLIGSPPGYIGSNEKGILREKSDISSQWVILFDEIEKASDKLHNLLLGFLDDGVIMDNHGVELDFRNSVFLFTSNVGLHEIVGRKMVGFKTSRMTYDNARDEVADAFKREFSPEFINRMDEIVYFNQLTTEDVGKIARLNLEKLPIKITAKLLRFIVDNAYSDEYGAREIKRFIRQNVTLKLADKVLGGSTSKIYKPVFKKKDFMVEGVE